MGTPLGFIDSPIKFKTADLDADGDLDLIGCSYGSGQHVWYENLDGMGTFSKASAIREFLECTEVTPADVDGDGDLDLTAISYSNDVVAWVENTLFTPSPALSGECTG